VSGYGTDSEDENDEDKEKITKTSLNPAQVEAPVILPSAEELAKLHSLASSSGMSGTASLLSSLLPTTKESLQPSNCRKRRWQGGSQGTEDTSLPSHPKKPVEEILEDLENLEKVKVGLSKENPGASALLETAMARNTKSTDPNDWDDVLEIEEERECKDFYTMRLERDVLPNDSHYDPVSQPDRDRFGNMKWKNPPKGAEIAGLGDFHGRRDFFFDGIKAKSGMWSEPGKQEKPENYR